LSSSARIAVLFSFNFSMTLSIDHYILDVKSDIVFGQFVILNTICMINIILSRLCLTSVFDMYKIKSNANHVKQKGGFMEIKGYKIEPYANLRRANLCEVNLIGANLRRADLRGADLRGANLFEVNLIGANLCEANLSGANLYGANLRGANLFEADLTRADLSGANLSGAKGLLDPYKWLEDNFKKTSEGFIVFKAIGDTYNAPPEHWIMKSGRVLTEVVNPNRTDECGCGVNFGTRAWVEENFKSRGSTIWECLLKWEYLIECIVPFNTDGKARSASLMLLRKL